MILSDRDLNFLCQTAEKAAKAAGIYIQEQLGKSYDQGQKTAGFSIASQVVTEVDFSAQELILSVLKESIAQFDIGILTEESADDQSRFKKDYFWCIDPLDGTLAFTEGKSGYAVSIALVSKVGDPIIGVVYIPDEEDLYTAIKGKGVFLNHKRFKNKEIQAADCLDVYEDLSLTKADNYKQLKIELENWVKRKEQTIKFHLGYGAVRNAIAVMHQQNACYFKFPKSQNGGGSIWDFAATRLFHEELSLNVSNAFGKKLKLNTKSTFMNHQGVVFANNVDISNFIISLGSKN